MKQIINRKPAPFLRLLLPLIVGILLENYFPIQAGFGIAAFFLSFLLIMICHAISFPKKFGMGWITGLAIQIAFLSFGRMLMVVHQDKQIEDTACFVKNQPNCLLLRLLSDPAPKQKSYKCLASVSWLIKNQMCYVEQEKILLWFNKKPETPRLSAGSLIIVSKQLQPIENIKSSGFDYKRYCRLKHIYAQVFLRESEFTVLHEESEKSMYAPLDSLRKKLLIIIKTRIPGKSEYSLLEALLVGFTEDLEPGLLKSYADTGVIHIIAISGLHLALICHILQLVLERVGQKKSARWIKLILIITCLWGYSLLSGASPSVIRAALMFSLVLFARNILRETALYNTLAASAFLLLCFDPYWIWDTGFQLSYAAVLGLGLFSKPVRDLLPLHNKLLAAIWNAASVSIAAQALTTPLCIYYFHRFPSYFLIANLLAVPVSSLILIGGILLCFFAPILPLAQFLGWILAWLIRFLNGYINYVSRLPGAVVGQFTINIPQLILIYFILFCFYQFLNRKEKTWLLTGLAAICIFQFINLIL